MNNIHHGKQNRKAISHQEHYFLPESFQPGRTARSAGEKRIELYPGNLSRDLKFLKVNKISDYEKGYIYELPDQHHIPGQELAESYAAQGFVSIQFANKLGIIRTLPGYAPSIASLIDKVNPFEIIGTLAGDDTILIIPHDNVTEKDVINTLIIIVPELKNKIK